MYSGFSSKKKAVSTSLSVKSSLPKKPNVVITVVPPEITEKIVKECKDIKIDKIWMQPGSESEKAIRFCKNNNLKIVANACFVMDNLNKNFGD